MNVLSRRVPTRRAMVVPVYLTENSTYQRLFRDDRRFRYKMGVVTRAAFKPRVYVFVWAVFRLATAGKGRAGTVVRSLLQTHRQNCHALLNVLNGR